MLPKKVAKEDHKPGSVPPEGYPPGGDDHSSRTAVADSLKQPDPGTLDGPSSSVPLFGLAPDGVYRAFDVTVETGELLPHPFTLTCGQNRQAVCSLWHFPWGCPRSPLGTILSCGARTFLPPPWPKAHAGSDHLFFFDQRSIRLPARHKAGGCNEDSSATRLPATNC